MWTPRSCALLRAPFDRHPRRYLRAVRELLQQARSRRHTTRAGAGQGAPAPPDPIDFLRQLDGRSIRAEDNFNAAYFDEPEYDRRLDAADGLPSPARELALGRLDVHVARTAAPWAVVANARTHDFFSARIGCQVYNPVLGLDLGSLCIRSRE
jgi:hypothetical protein